MYTYNFREGTSSAAASRNLILGPSEPGVEIDTGKFKLGDGVTPWNDLPYFLNEDGVAALIEEALESSGGSGADTRIGSMAALTTTEKGTVVGAINEVNTPSIPLTSLYNNAKAG